MQLRSYQQQYEKLKAQYAERATRVDAATKVRHREPHVFGRQCTGRQGWVQA